MKKLGLWLLGAALPLALALSGCGGLAQAGENTSAPTITSGPVTIATDHSAYANRDAMKITIVNHLSTPIYAYDTQASCSILSLEMQSNGKWQPSYALHCPLGRIALPVKIAAGGTYSTTIGAAVIHIGSATPLADGTYRLVLEYFDSLPKASSQPPTSTTIYSANLTVSGSVPPSSTSIPKAPGIPLNTPVKGSGG
ncbi:MAG TPA: hypothetical protein VF808_05240 [Ktedonobacterales bacterium]